MTDQMKTAWYYVIVQNPGTPGEHFVGYENRDTGLTFIPAFKTKEMAQQCFTIMPKDIMNETYEAQAIIKEDLVHEAQKNNFDVFLLDDKGRVLEKMS